MTRRTDHDQDALRDPLLSALLREAYADDPALAPAPGRTERIMRGVLTAHRSRREWGGWSLIGWSFGATAMAAAVIAMMIMMAQPRQDIAEAIARDAHRIAVNPPPNRQTSGTTQLEDIAAPFNVVKPLPTQDVPVTPRTPDAPEKPMNNWQPTPRPAPASVPREQPVTVAASLYAAGTAAYASGEYEAAYEAYQDSYDTVPTPEAILSSGLVLQRLAQEALASEG